MLRTQANAGLYLLPSNELNSEDHDLPADDLAHMRTMYDWSRDYLFKNDKKLGRKGPVCPFVRPAIESHDSLYFTLERDLEMESIKEKLVGYRDWFLNLKPTGRIKRNFKAIIFLLPELLGDERQTEFIETIHEELKPRWVEHGLMLGQFYPRCDAEGLHNADYRPLRTPVPLFVMRHMQLTDLPFLVKTELFIRSYCRTFDVRTQSELEQRISEAHIPKLPLNWDDCMARVFGVDMARASTT